jgi:antibiotic biosynthesis monooxygenase (ABM) superfamily enzyme
VVFPLTMLLPLLLDRVWSVLGVQPHEAVVKLLSAMAMVGLMVWVIFPVMTARLSRWLVR